MTGLRQNPPRKEGCRLPPLLCHQQLGSQDEAIEQRGQGQKAQRWVRKANRGVSQVEKSLEGGRRPQQKRGGIRRPLGPIFNTTGRDTPEVQVSKSGAAFNQAEWTQGARTAGKWDFSKEIWKTVRVHMSKKRLQWKKKKKKKQQRTEDKGGNWHAESQDYRPQTPQHHDQYESPTIWKSAHCHTA